MGARAIEETNYPYQGASKMRAAQIDMGLIGQASFAKYFNDTSFDYKKYDFGMQISNSSFSSQYQIYQGVQPVIENMTQWLQAVKENPVPVIYKLTPISELLSLIKDPAFDLSSALYQLNNQIDNECVKFGCKLPGNNFAPAPAAKSELVWTAVYGNSSHNTTNHFKDFDNATVLRDVR